MSSTPFSWIRLSSERKALVWATLLTIAVMVAMNSIGRSLVTPVAPQGIVSFELSGDLARAEGILAAWGEAGRLAAALSLGLDYLFLFAYPASIGLACSLAARALQRWMRPAAAAGQVLAWALPAAGVLDAIENYALIRLLLGSRQPAWPPLAFGCAVVKFAIVAAGLAFVMIFGAVAIALSRRAPVGS